MCHHAYKWLGLGFAFYGFLLNVRCVLRTVLTLKLNFVKLMIIKKLGNIDFIINNNTNLLGIANIFCQLNKFRDNIYLFFPFFNIFYIILILREFFYFVIKVIDCKLIVINTIFPEILNIIKVSFRIGAKLVPKNRLIKIIRKKFF